MRVTRMTLKWKRKSDMKIRRREQSTVLRKCDWTEWLLPSPVVSCHSVRALVLPKGSALTEVTASSTGLLVEESAEIRS